ncbi:GNAT family N-acetyltransferase [Phaeobacter sp. HF9A]|uniref:GNAT family N-acetyltransferase n=1 Tax=Phaeobacter sp. HF9A TaxID=2721561 RepID=UPI001431AC45|nr:GNAT family N-acetyltransferase [Phaeobacter sp. HF9A]NIZ13600.1 GNAT family N-acetyltransferase [Phaeobacter sp. HF9A]
MSAPSSPLEIRAADPDGQDVRPLLLAHEAHTSSTSSPEACHALNIEGLQSPDIRFFAAYRGDSALGCAALKDLGAGRMEIKSVHVASAARGQGIARQLMLALHDIARSAGAEQLLLETGSDRLPPFDAARALYERLGYRYCAPFGDYTAHPESAFMQINLTG